MKLSENHHQQKTEFLSFFPVITAAGRATGKQEQPGFADFFCPWRNTEDKKKSLKA